MAPSHAIKGSLAHLSLRGQNLGGSSSRPAVLSPAGCTIRKKNLDNHIFFPSGLAFLVFTTKTADDQMTFNTLSQPTRTNSLLCDLAGCRRHILLCLSVQPGVRTSLPLCRRWREREAPHAVPARLPGVLVGHRVIGLLQPLDV